MIDTDIKDLPDCQRCFTVKICRLAANGGHIWHMECHCAFARPFHSTLEEACQEWIRRQQGAANSKGSMTITFQEADKYEKIDDVKLKGIKTVELTGVTVKSISYGDEVKSEGVTDQEFDTFILGERWSPE